MLWVVFGCYWQKNRQSRWWNQTLRENRGASLGVPTAFRYAAHDLMNHHLSDDVHNYEVCDRFNYEAECFTGMSQDGAMHLAIDDAKGETWHFFETAPDDSKILPI